MTDKFKPGRLGDWIVYCDICGRKCRASETVILTQYTGRGGMVVCKQDIDVIDHGLIPYTIPIEKNVPFTRINHQDTADGSPLLDLESMTYIYYLSASQDNFIITASQDDAWISVGESV